MTRKRGCLPIGMNEAQIARRDVLVKGLRARYVEAQAATEAYRDAIADYSAWLEDAQALLEEISDDALTAIDERPAAWRRSPDGREADNWHGEIQRMQENFAPIEVDDLEDVSDDLEELAIAPDLEGEE